MYFTIPLQLNFQRPPVEWERTPPKEATYIFPYVIFWSEITTQVLIYNLLDQQCVQEIPFPVSGSQPPPLSFSLTLSLSLSLPPCFSHTVYCGDCYFSFRMVAVLETSLANSTQLMTVPSTTSPKFPSKIK